MPSGQDGACIRVYRIRRLDLEIVAAERVSNGEISTGLTDTAVTTLPLATLQFSQWTVQPYEEDVPMFQQEQQLFHPFRCLYDVLNDQVVARVGKSGDRPVKALEEGSSQLCPWKLARGDSSVRQNVCGTEMID